ncbi:hypothetical protein SAMN05444360_101230 [Chryseobacterium carnipullorum]|uniref:T9SS type A sorting domain-containing protein n=1 Tax=Chryseobacterium carnipullorum TaxID=1124835 RepID=UPI00091BFEA0|nr:T9SS type A sorting domain-containing protein [Chryseobacterium carnipullorum]SHL34830.1 hypothetical protein SAMN05444360_101230 [Chryseobacterium carnipullorum]
MKKKLSFFFLILFWLTSLAQNSNVCFNRLHNSFAEALIPVNQWNGSTVSFKIYFTTGGLFNGYNYDVNNLTKVNKNGQEYYYVKVGTTQDFSNQTLIYEVSSPSDAAVSSTLAAIPQSDWNDYTKQKQCVDKANVCFNRLHNGFAEALIPVNQWNGDTKVNFKIYLATGGLFNGYNYNVNDLAKVTKNGQEYYYLKVGTSQDFSSQTLTYEVSSPKNAAVSNTLAAVPQSDWNDYTKQEQCVDKANVCFNRLHNSFAEALIPVNEWNGDTTVSFKIYLAAGGLWNVYNYNVNNLTKVNKNGQDYYYIKEGTSQDFSSQTLTYEVSSPKNAAVSNTLAPRPQSDWNDYTKQEQCIDKANVCFNRLHNSFAEALIPVNEWNGDTTVSFKIYLAAGGLWNVYNYNVNNLTKVNKNGQDYYYIKEGTSQDFSNQTLTYEVSSPKNAAVSNTLAPLPQSEWNDLTKQEQCVDKANGICINRNNADYTIYIPVNQWNGNNATVKRYLSNGAFFNALSFSNLTTEIHNGVLSYKIVTGFSQFENANVIIGVTSSSNAEVHAYISPVQEICYENAACTNPITPTFTSISPICAGSALTLPSTSTQGISGTWSPAINNQATTTYTFTPNAGQCASTNTMTVTVNPPANLVLTSGNNTQTVEVNTAITPITYTFNGATGTSVTGLPAGITATVNGTTVTISGTATTAGIYNYTVTVTGGCAPVNLQGTITVVAAKDWKLAPNSYIFTGKDDTGNEVDGLYIPVKKAYKMWQDNVMYLNKTSLPQGTITADVLWEDTPGLIKSGENYSLEMTGEAENAKIKIPIKKSLEGNAVIAFKVNGEVQWSWHVWVTDDPTNGSKYRSYGDEARLLKNGTQERIPDSDWGWMDRNLGALGASITGTDQYDKNGGLLYQWGRKDPFPPLITRGNTYYEVSGSIGKVRDVKASLENGANYKILTDIAITVPKADAFITNNLPLSIKNPLSLIYSDALHYDGVSSSRYNWFGYINGTSVNPSNNARVNFWSDNAQGNINNSTETTTTAKNVYRNKEKYDPCPNGWRIPSMLTTFAYYSGIPLNRSPFGPKSNDNADIYYTTNSVSNTLKIGANPYYGFIKPNYNNFPSYPNYLKSIKVYSNIGVDMTNFGGDNLGLFPGTGKILWKMPNEDSYGDMHQTRLWTATMARTVFGGSNNGSTSNTARGLLIIPENEPNSTNDTPDPSLNVIGRYSYNPMYEMHTTDAAGCRCIKDPLYKDNDYNFPTEFFTDQKNYGKEYLNQPNSYQRVKSTAELTIEIPVSKAIAMQNQYMNNLEILNPVSYNSLKANVHWSNNTQLIKNISVLNSSPASLAAISNSKIKVLINPNQSGNAVVTLHNGSIDNPVYWSWHIWITDTEVGSYLYTTDMGDPAAPNFVNYVKGLSSNAVKQAQLMDRDLGALQVLPSSLQTQGAPTEAELSQIQNSAGLHYQWGRKDPFPVFHENVNNNKTSVFLGRANADGSITYSELTADTFENAGSNYIIPYNTYANSANVSGNDKTADKIAKVLGYSVKNPLVFMIPSTLNPYNGVRTMGTDWLINQASQFPERWGKGTSKSPFDPCPEGWRIPDADSSNDSETGLGGSLWYKKNVFVAGKNAVNDYLGTPIKNGNTILGYAFQNPAYKIGNYGTSGIRGNRSIIFSSAPSIPTKVEFGNGKRWTAALRTAYQGRPISMTFSTANNNLYLADSDNSQYFGAPCRCVKILSRNEKEEGFYPDNVTIPVQSDAISRAGNVFTEKEIKKKIEQKKLSVFPNPVTDIVYIDAKDSRDYYYQIYNLSGQLVKEGKFENNKTNLSNLLSGAYIIRINNSELVVKIIKK